jgi:hypothetical protein
MINRINTYYYLPFSDHFRVIVVTSHQISGLASRQCRQAPSQQHPHHFTTATAARVFTTMDNFKANVDKFFSAGLGKVHY